MSSWSGWCVLGTASVMMSFSYTDDRIRKTLRDMFMRREQTFRGDERGSALIEAAILTPLLIALFLHQPRRSRPRTCPAARLPFRRPLPRRERPHGRAEKRDELAPLHVCAHPITSSAATCSVSRL